MNKLIHLLLVTTDQDLSKGYFSGLRNVNCEFADYDQDPGLYTEMNYDYIYFRDPFVVENYNENKITRWVNVMRKSFPAAKFIDGIEVYGDLLIEDKWIQYNQYPMYMPKTVLAGNIKTISQNEIAKKRVSSRARDVYVGPMTGLELNSDYILQEKLAIINEYRVYVINGVVLERIAVKHSKTQTRKVKVGGIVDIDDRLRSYIERLKEGIHLDFYGLDIAQTASSYRLIEINRAPQFMRYNELAGTNIAQLLFVGE